MLKNLISLKNPKSHAAEAFRTLRTNIQFSSLDDDLKSIVVTSTGPSEGKSTVMANLAVTMAESGKKVLLIDCDFRKPTVHKKFGLPNSKGLTNILVQDKTIYECIIHTKISNLYIIPSGPTPPNPAELLASRKMKSILEDIKNMVDIVLIDAPPVLAVTDAQILSTLACGTIFVASYGQAEKNGLVKAKEAIEKVGGKVIGVVINKIPKKSMEYSNYYYYTYK